MREITRITLRIGMIIILLVGCVHNVYHFKKIADNGRRYDPYYRTYTNIEDDPINELDEVVVTPETYDSIEEEEEEYQERERVRSSSYRY